ncbi:glycoside hydrolase family 2 [Nocardioides marmoriginsengisoli]|uniref:Glycoside hydrolase family 2 n=1 Tax=Nocardioides marmoriginsengisoli TaxID=661483 RepID=A0A3N0CE39_9ACTN|nr:sugar-binding domain-containing protein [Nocardioides marmoriginsengisoli]RNL61273.1 glycoside hydrolase family 2 [Nocardioides marmoriginsengisoli]
MLTRWGRDLDPDRPLPEYPRPQLVRGPSSWVNLNGRWEYAFGGIDRPEHPDGRIVVPFSPEAALSGVGRQLQPDEWLWYRRTGVAAPAGDRVLAHFGAVDQTCTVWVNGTEVGSHTGGYLPFTIDITDALVAGSQTIEVRVRDLSETGPHARGKQRLDRGRIWYTAQSGIWQTVWLEAVPSRYVEELRIVPDVEGATLAVTVQASRQARRPDIADEGADLEPVEMPAHVRVLDHGTVVAESTGPAGTPLRLPIPHPRLWSPADPFLYDLEITYGDDSITSYAAMRSFGIGEDDRGRRRFLLNGEPIQHVGVLDQGYWPDGLLTAPADEAMVHDISTMKDLGFTMLRKHAKVEPLRWYHHCDRLGMLVWQDVVNGGGRYRELTANLPARWPIRLSDRRYPLFFRDDAAAREEFRDEVRRTVALLANTASVCVWTPFNEAWGQFDANEIAAEVAALDPTRAVNHVSGWIDQGGGDVKSYHSYLRPFRLRTRRRERRVHALTEYGGHSLQVAGHDWSSTEFGYRHCETPAELAAGFVALHVDEIAPAVERGLAATVYTQLSDIEDELNGLLTWDREVLKIPADVIRATLGTIRD